MRILIADDSNSSRIVLEKILIRLGYQVTACSSGSEVMAAKEAGNLPQLLILDCLMPGLDGIEVCRRIREDASGPYTHIILLTAQTEPDTIIKGLRAGINDFIPKPIQAEELQGRLETGVKLVELNNVVSKQRLRMIQSYKLAALGQMAKGVAQEISDPLLTLLSQLESFEDKLSGNDQLGLRETKREMSTAVMAISRAVRGLGILMEENPVEFTPTVNVSSILEQALDLCRENALRNGVELRNRGCDPSLIFAGRRVEICHAILNLVENAIEAVSQREDRWVELSANSEGGWIHISVVDSGDGVPEKIRKSIMQPFVTSKQTAFGNGLGLTIAREAIAAHGGSLSLDTQSSNTRFVISIPRVGAAAKLAA